MKYFLLLTTVFACVATADTMMFATPPGTTIAGAGAVSANAMFTTTAGTLTIVLNNLQANETDDGQAISDLEFQFAGPLAGTTTLASDTGTTVSVSNKTPTFGGSISAGWGFGSYNSGFIVCIICGSTGVTPPYQTSPPSHLILGPGPYTNANSSIDNHSPYINQTLTITISNPNITTATDISNVVFSFGTTFGSDVQAQVVTPEPSGVLLLSLIAVPLAFWRLKSRLQRG